MSLQASSESLLATMLIEDEKKKLKMLDHNARLRIQARTNELLAMCGSEQRVESVRGISSAILIFIFERICNTTLIGKLTTLELELRVSAFLRRCWSLLDKILPTGGHDDEVHNIQAIVDALSLDILHEDLSYLTGEAIYSAIKHSKHSKKSSKKSHHKRYDLSSVEYLLDLFVGLNEWLASQIETTASSLPNPENHPHQLAPSSQATRPNGAKSQQEQDLNRKLSELSLKDPETPAQVVTSKVTVTLEQENEDEEDIFASYLREKEEEFKRRSLLSNTTLEESTELKAPRTPLTESEWQELTTRYGPQQQQPQLVADQRDGIDSSEFQQFLRDRALGQAHALEHDGQDDQSESEESCRELQVHRSSFKPRPQYKAQELQLYHEHPNQEALLNNDFDVLRNKMDGQTGRQTQLVKAHLKRLYESDIKDMRSVMTQSLLKLKSRSELIDNLYKSSKETASSSGCHGNQSRVAKGFLLPNERVIKSKARCSNDCLSTSHHNKSLTNRSTSSCASSARPRRPASACSRSRALSCATGTKKRRKISDDQLLNILFDEFPYLYTSPQTIHHLWQKNSKQIKLLNRLKDEIKNKYLHPNENNLKNLTMAQLADIQRRQQLQMEIVRSEQVSQQRKDDLRRKQQVENSIKARQREQRSQNARIRRYYEEYRMQQKLRMIKHSAEEEMIIKRLFADIFKAQKERILDLKKYAKEKYALNSERQMAELESIENFYKNKFNMIKEQMSREKSELEVSEKAQQGVLSTLRKNLGKKLETEIKDLQKQLCDSESTIHWRNMDADRLKKELVAV